MSKINVIECMTTWQGEGPDTGKRMLLLRFKKCNRNCSWCDTAIKMRTGVESSLSLDEIQTVVSEEKAGLMITGGEPTFSNNLEQCISLINNVDAHIYNVETNGYNLKGLVEGVNKPNCRFMYSPKIFNDGDLDVALNLIEEVILKNPNIYIKIVCEEDNKFILEYMRILSEDCPELISRVYLMPKGVTKEELLENAGFVFDTAEKYKFNISSRDHLIYNFI